MAIIHLAGPSSQGHNKIPSEENKKDSRKKKRFSKLTAENEGKEEKKKKRSWPNLCETRS